MPGIIALVLLFTNCKSNEKQIERTWTIVSVTADGKDVSADYKTSGYKETYQDGKYSYSGQPGSTASGSGNYTWNGNTELKRNGVSGQSSVTCTLKKLDRNDFQYSYVDNGKEWIFTFEK